MTIVVSGGYAWIADRDRVAHAHPARSRSVRTLCDRPSVDPRYAYPAAVRCEACQAVAERRA